ncbi:MAG TPA: hypothetical protein VFH61_18335 [Thermoleophilia bacterium]|nr:hypothetical protein [Thermoleophilia bacterium]
MMVPPRVDLSRHEVVGLVEFTSSDAGALGPLTTKRFLEAARRDQGLVRVVLLGTEADVLAEVGRGRLDQAALQALGQRHQIRTVITGELDVSEVRPDVRIAPGLKYARIAAEVEATLSTNMVETATGASIWSDTSTTKQRVAQISVHGGDVFTFDADHPDEAYGTLVGTLVEQVTRDFRTTWVRR